MSHKTSLFLLFLVIVLALLVILFAVSRGTPMQPLLPIPRQDLSPFSYSEMNFTLPPSDPFFDVLTQEVLHRSWAWNETCSLGLAPSFCRVLQKLDQGKCLTIHILGGSTSVGTVGKEFLHKQLIWFTQFETWLNKRFPCGSKHRIGAYARGGANSEHHLGSLPPNLNRHNCLRRDPLPYCQIQGDRH